MQHAHAWFPPASALLQVAPEGAILVLQGCGHNPTGVDPTPQQWQGILAAAQQRRLFVFLDNAYQVLGRVLSLRLKGGRPTCSEPCALLAGCASGVASRPIGSRPTARFTLVLAPPGAPLSHCCWPWPAGLRQGFVHDLEADAAAVRLFAEAGLELLVAQSFSKSMGLYGERVGALHLVAAAADVARGAEAALQEVRSGRRGAPSRTQGGRQTAARHDA